MVPPTRPIPHSYSVGAKTTSPPAAKPRRPPSATPSHPSTAALLHHAGADTPMSSSTATSTATPSTASSWSRGRAVRTRASSTTPSCASPLPLQLRHPPPHRSCSCYAVLRRLGSASPPPTYGHGNTVNNLAMGSSKPAPSRTSVSPVKRRRSARHVEVTTPATEKGTPLPLFVQILRLCLHGIHPTEDTSWPLLLDTRCS